MPRDQPQTAQPAELQGRGVRGSRQTHANATFDHGMVLNTYNDAVGTSSGAVDGDDALYLQPVVGSGGIEHDSDMYLAPVPTAGAPERHGQAAPLGTAAESSSDYEYAPVSLDHANGGGGVPRAQSEHEYASPNLRSGDSDAHNTSVDTSLLRAHSSTDVGSGNDGGSCTPYGNVGAFPGPVAGVASVEQDELSASKVDMYSNADAIRAESRANDAKRHTVGIFSIPLEVVNSAATAGCGRGGGRGRGGCRHARRAVFDRDPDDDGSDDDDSDGISYINAAAIAQLARNSATLPAQEKGHAVGRFVVPFSPGSTSTVGGQVMKGTVTKKLPTAASSPAADEDQYQNVDAIRNGQGQHDGGAAVSYSTSDTGSTRGTLQRNASVYDGFGRATEEVELQQTQNSSNGTRTFSREESLRGFAAVSHGLAEVNNV